MSDNFEIVKVNYDDIPQLAQVANSIWHEYFTPIIGKQQVEYMVDKFQSVKGLTEQFSNGYAYYFAKEKGIIVGYCGVQPQGEKLFLSKLYLQKENRGKGFAGIMFNYIKQLAGKQNKKSIYLTVNRYNTNTIDVYKHLGFIVTKEQKTDIGSGFYMDDYVMEYML